MNQALYNEETNDQIITKNIETYGWHVNKVEEDEYGPSYAYTIGLYKSFQHPEIIIIGPEVDIAHFILNIIGEAILKGTTFKPDSYYPSLIKDAFLYFPPVDQKYYKTYVDHALHYYNDHAFPLLQCVYPAPNGSYPGQAEWPNHLNSMQPFLGGIPVKEFEEPTSVYEDAIKIPLPILD